MNVLVVDIGGAHVKILATGQKQSREFPSGPKMTPRKMVAGVKKLAKDDIVRFEGVLGGGNVKKLKKLPLGCTVGDNANAFVGGFRVWQKNNRGNRSKSERAVSKAARKPRE